MASSKIKDLHVVIRNIELKLISLEKLDNNSNCSQAEQILSDTDKLIKKAYEIIEDINSDNSLTGRLLDSAKTEERDLDIYEKKYKEQAEKWAKERRKQDLIDGKLTGADAIKGQREMACDNVREVDNQGLMIDDIAENIKTANVNLTNVNVGLNEQGEQMNRVQKITLETESQVKQTGKIMNRMEGRAKCIQIITFLAVVLFGLFDIFWIVFLCIKKFYWDKKKK